MGGPARRSDRVPAQRRPPGDAATEVLPVVPAGADSTVVIPAVGSDPGATAVLPRIAPDPPAADRPAPRVGTGFNRPSTGGPPRGRERWRNGRA